MSRWLNHSTVGFRRQLNICNYLILSPVGKFSNPLPSAKKLNNFSILKYKTDGETILLFTVTQ